MATEKKTGGFWTKGKMVHFHWWREISASVSSVQFSPLTDWVVGGTRGAIQQRFSSSLFCRRRLWVVLAAARMSNLWCCPFSIFSADHGVAYPPRCPWRMFFERLSWRVTCPNHGSSCLLTAARRVSCGPTRKLIFLRTQSLVLCSKQKIRRSLLRQFVSKAWILKQEVWKWLI